MKIKSFLIIFCAALLLVSYLFTGCTNSTGYDKSQQYSSQDTTDTESILEDLDDDYLLECLRGKRIGVITGTIWDKLAEETIPECQLMYFNSNTDMTAALELGKIDAYLLDEPIAQLYVKQYKSQCILCMVMEDYYGYIFKKGDSENDKLREQMDEFLTKSKEDGTLQEIKNLWFGEDENIKVIDYTGLSGENGTLNFACATNSGPPFSYLKNGKYAGYDVDIAVRFCREYGYDINIMDTDFNGMIALVTSGKCDFGASCISITEERKESMNFSVSNYDGGAVAVTTKSLAEEIWSDGNYDLASYEKSSGEETENDESVIVDASVYESLQGTKIAVNANTKYGDIAKELIPKCSVEYLNSDADLAKALEINKVDAYLTTEPAARLLLKKYEDQKIKAVVSQESHAYLFQKGNKRGKLLCNQMNEFLSKLSEEKTLQEIDDIWFGSDETKKTIDLGGLVKTNGELTMAVSADAGTPLCYIKNGEYVGYDLDIAVRFCKKYGYGLKLIEKDFSDIPSAVSEGICDFGAYDIMASEDYTDTVNFSDSVYDGGLVIITREKGEFDLSQITDEDEYEKYRGQKIGVVVGTIFDNVADNLIPDCEIVYYKNKTELAEALEKDEIDAYLQDQAQARLFKAKYPGHHVVAVVSQSEYGFIFQKDNVESELLCAQMNAFLSRLQNNGTMDELDSIWFGSDPSVQTVDYSGLSGENGTLRFAVYCEPDDPFMRIENGVHVGYEMDIAVRFCREYGYNIEIIDCDFDEMLSSVSEGKYDFGASCITISEERKETLLFSDPDYYGGSVMLAKNLNTEKDNAFKKIIRTIHTGFRKTFIRENRWKLFLQGTGITLLITIISAFLGTVTGFFVFLGYRKKITLLKTLVDILLDVFEKTPVIVVLMIFYYIVFGNTQMDGMWVSCIGFSLIFTCSVINGLKVSVDAVDHGQMEAATAIGFTDTRAFLRVIFPQALRHFLPIFRGDIVTLIKSTAIVGYIAVQDLTKVSDIIRSRTYEAFFPLIVSAVIYFCIAWMLTLIVKRIQIETDPKHRSADEILKGVRRK